MPTDLNRLHKTHELLTKWGSYERRAGKTTYHCHEVAGQLMISPPGSVVVAILEYYDRWEQFVDMLIPILEEDYKITDYDRPVKRYELSFSKSILRVKFVSVEDMYEKLRGLPHDQQLIMDLEGLPSWYFSNPILAGESWELRELQERLLNRRRCYDTPTYAEYLRQEWSKQS